MTAMPECVESVTKTFVNKNYKGLRAVQSTVEVKLKPGSDPSSGWHEWFRAVGLARPESAVRWEMWCESKPDGSGILWNAIDVFPQGPDTDKAN